MRARMQPISDKMPDGSAKPADALRVGPPAEATDVWQTIEKGTSLEEVAFTGSGRLAYCTYSKTHLNFSLGINPPSKVSLAQLMGELAVASHGETALVCTPVIIFLKYQALHSTG